jgi:hypothetical protein
MARYAIGIVGQLRSFYQKNVYENILASINPIKGFADVFFCFGEHGDVDYISDNMLADTFNPVSTQRYSSKRCEAGNKHGQDNGLWMARGWLTLYRQILEQEEKNNSPYELIIKLRPDIMLGSYFHDNIDIDTEKSEVYVEYFGSDDVNDCSAMITRSALKPYLHDFYHDFYSIDTFSECGNHPEGKLRWTLVNKGVTIGEASFKEKIIRQYNNETWDKLLPIEITRRPDTGNK